MPVGTSFLQVDRKAVQLLVEKFRKAKYLIVWGNRNREQPWTYTAEARPSPTARAVLQLSLHEIGCDHT